MHADNRQQLLTQTVADFFDVDPTEMNRTFPLSGPRMQGSLPRYALDAAIRRRVGVAIGAVHKAGTFAELEDELLGRSPQTDSTTPSPASGPAPQPLAPAKHSPSATAMAVSGLNAPTACGVDMQRIDSLPTTDDVWEHPFYAKTFTKAEIAYCLSRENPAESFAARWCAKEAVKKCDPTWLAAEMSSIEVVLDEQGAPTLWSIDGSRKERLPLAVSLSHTEEMAIAIVIQSGPHSIQTEAPNASTVAMMDSFDRVSSAESNIQPVESNGATHSHSSVSGASHKSAKRSGRLTLFFSLVGLAMAGFALWRTFQ